MSKYIKAKDAIKILGVTPTTLRNWAKTGKIKYIRSAGGMRLYDISQFELSHKKNVCYCRVASKKQITDLEIQVKLMQSIFPEYELIIDIASGLDLKRQGIQQILDYCYNGEIGTVVIVNEDRLARFGFEFIEYIIGKFGGKIQVLSETGYKSPKEEVLGELDNILDIFSQEVDELVKYKTMLKEDDALLCIK